MANRKIKLTIVTTVYNQEEYISQALDSFLMQKTNFPFEIIISDDCSTDSTGKILKNYAKKHPDIIKPIFNKKNVGAMQNFINTLSLVKTEYVALCDGDDFWTDDLKLQKQVDFLDDNKDFSLCFHQTNIFFEDGSNADRIYPMNISKTTTFDELIKECYIPANTVVYRWIFNRTQKLKDVFPKNVVPGDYYVHLLHAKHGKIGFIDEVMSCYRRHENGMWWLTSQKDKQDEFYLKYGIQYLNFFKSLDETFRLDYKINNEKETYLINNLIRCYLENYMFEELVNLKKDNKILFEKCIINYSYVSIYNNLSKLKKILYLLLVDRSTLKVKIKEYIKRKCRLLSNRNNERRNNNDKKT